MTIEIHQPELEALILDRMQKGEYKSIEDILLQALTAAPLPSQDDISSQKESSVPTGAVLIAAMQASPDQDISLEPPRSEMPVRDIAS